MSDLTPTQAAEQAHRQAIEQALQEHPNWSTRDFAEHWGDCSHPTVARWFKKYGIKTNPIWGRPSTGKDIA
jgi:hypothetical protein